MFDTEKFILEVEKHECLWNITSKCYLDRVAKSQAWAEVGKTILSSWNSYSVQEKVKASRVIQKKWKNIKDYFLKELKAQKNSKSGLKRNKYIYFDMLTFLIPTMEYRKSSSKSEFDIDAPIEESADESLNNNILKHLQESIKIKKKEKREIFFEESLLSILNQWKMNIIDEMDADKAFFTSLIPIVKKFDDRQKIEFQIEVLNALKRVTEQVSSVENLNTASSTHVCPASASTLAQSFHFYPQTITTPVESHCDSPSSMSSISAESENSFQEIQDLNHVK